MAKSLRSKWRRKMRNIKREKYGERELEKLKLLVKNSEKVSKSKPVERKQVSTDKKDAKMETDETVKTFNKKTKRDENGQYPAWMNKRAIRKHKHRIGEKRKRRRW